MAKKVTMKKVEQIVTSQCRKALSEFVGKANLMFKKPISGYNSAKYDNLRREYSKMLGKGCSTWIRKGGISDMKGYLDTFGSRTDFIEEL